MIEMAKAIRLGGLTIQYQTDEVLRLWIEVGFQIHILIYILYLELLIQQISYQNLFINTICNYKYSPLLIIDMLRHQPHTSEPNSPSMVLWDKWCCKSV